MKKYLPFLITGVLSAGLALGIFTFLGKPDGSVESRTPLAVFTNRSPFDYTSALFTPPGSSDLVTAANIARQAVVYIEARTTSTGSYFSRRSYSGRAPGQE
jgi:hypothetical protein